MLCAMCHDQPFQPSVRWGTTLCSKWMTAVHFIRLQTQFVIDKLFTLDEARNPFTCILVQIHLLHQRICYAKFVDLNEIHIWYHLHKSFVKKLIDMFDLSCVYNRRGYISQTRTKIIFSRQCLIWTLVPNFTENNWVLLRLKYSMWMGRQINATVIGFYVLYSKNT